MLYGECGLWMRAPCGVCYCVFELKYIMIQTASIGCGRCGGGGGGGGGEDRDHPQWYYIGCSDGRAGHAAAATQ